MTIIKTAEYSELVCDKCAKNLVVFGEAKRTIRARARNEGWRANVALDVCPAHPQVYS